MRSERLSLKLFAGALAVLLLLGEPSLRGSQNSEAPQQGGIRVQVNLVNLFATVRDKKTKQIISNLEQGDFKVTEDGAEQKISFFSRESTLPITLGLLVDTSGSETNTLGAEQEAAVRFLSRVLKKGDLAMVVSFDTDSDLLADLTDDQGRLDRAINRARINAPSSQGPLPTTIPGTVFYDAVYAACHDRLAEEAGRKAIVVLTDAQDEGSTLKLQDAIEAAQRTDTVVHILLIADPRYGGGNETVAKKLTDETGGRTIVVRNEKKLEEAFDQISEELRSQYTIGYYSSNSARDGSYRKIKVDTTRKDLDVLARRGYYAPKN
jgi:VWFA-related protein